MWKRIFRVVLRQLMEEINALDNPPALVIQGAYVALSLSQDKTAFISPDDFERIKHIKWWASKHSRPGCKEKWYVKGWHDGKEVYLHRFLMGFPQGMVVDHEDANGLNNTRENLRVVTQAKNTAHCRFRGAKEKSEPFL